MELKTQIGRMFSLLWISLLLVACGGGGSDDNGASAGGGGDNPGGNNIEFMMFPDALTLKPGDRLPLSYFKARQNGDGWLPVTSLGEVVATFSSADLSILDNEIVVSENAASGTQVYLDLNLNGGEGINVEIIIESTNYYPDLFSTGSGKSLLPAATSAGMKSIAYQGSLNDAYITAFQANTVGAYPVISINGKSAFPELAVGAQQNVTISYPDGRSETVKLIRIESLHSAVLAGQITGSPLAFRGMTLQSLLSVSVTTESGIKLDIGGSLDFGGSSNFQNGSDSGVVLINDPFDIGSRFGVTLPQQQEIPLVAFDQMSASKPYMTTSVNQPITFQVYGDYQGKRYDITQYVDLRLMWSGWAGTSDNPAQDYGYDDLLTQCNAECLQWNSNTSELIAAEEGIYNVTAVGLLSNTEFVAHMEVGAAVPEPQQGRWQYVESGSTRFLSDYAYSSFTTVDANTLIDTTNDLYMIRAGISDVAVSGNLAEVVAVNQPLMAFVRSGGLSGIGGIDVILQNLENGETTTLTTDENGSFSGQLDTGEYILTSEIERDDNGSSEIIKVEADLTIEGEEKDLGNFTLVTKDDYNFDATLLAADLVFFGYNDGQTQRQYSKDVRIQNTGIKDISGALVRVTASQGENLFRNLDVSINGNSVVTDADGFFLLGGISAGNNKNITFAYSFLRPEQDTDVEVTVEIKDAQNRVWTDRVPMRVSANIPVPVEIQAYLSSGDGEVAGYIVTPGRTLLRVKTTGSAQGVVDLTFKVNDSYEIVFSNTSADKESVYSLGLGVSVDRSEFVGFTNVNKYEATNGGQGDNTVSGATILHYGEKDISYVLTNDIDFFRFDMTSDSQPAP